MTFRTIINIIAYYGVPLAAMGLTLFAWDEETFLTLGDVSLYLLYVILFLSPVSTVFPYPYIRKAMAYRRQMGVSAFWFAFVHTAGEFYHHDLTVLSEYIVLTDYIFYGAVGFLGMIILALTSNDFSLRLLKRNWKRVQYIAYPVLFLALAHAAIATQEFAEYISIGGAYIVLKVLAYKHIRFDNVFARVTKQQA